LRGVEPRTISPRFVLIHTFAHLLINELIFACGYSSASLRERLYVSETLGRTMAGLLIYTAAGDSEGTMGGLVRQAKPENLWPVMANAINDARWCSTDPTAPAYLCSVSDCAWCLIRGAAVTGGFLRLC
jgi:hypothetical protein